jgi:hypothetical protein
MGLHSGKSTSSKGIGKESPVEAMPSDSFRTIYLSVWATQFEVLCAHRMTRGEVNASMGFSGSQIVMVTSTSDVQLLHVGYTGLFWSVLLLHYIFTHIWALRMITLILHNHHPIPPKVLAHWETGMPLFRILPKTKHLSMGEWYITSLWSPESHEISKPLTQRWFRYIMAGSFQISLRVIKPLLSASLAVLHNEHEHLHWAHCNQNLVNSDQMSLASLATMTTNFTSKITKKLQNTDRLHIAHTVEEWLQTEYCKGLKIYFNTNRAGRISLFPAGISIPWPLLAEEWAPKRCLLTLGAKTDTCGAWVRYTHALCN